MLYMNNTHFNQNDDIQCEAVSGFGGLVGNGLALIESAEITHSIFEAAIRVDFMEVGVKHGIVAESMVDEAINESEGKFKGLINKAVEAVKKFWATITNAITNAIKSIEEFCQKHIDKFLDKIQLKSKEELKKKTIKKYTMIDLSKLELKRPEAKDFFSLSKEELEKAVAKSSSDIEKEMIKNACGKDYSNMNEFKAKFVEECFSDKTNISIADVIDDAINFLRTAREFSRSLKDMKKKIDSTYKESVKQLKSKEKSVRTTGGYTNVTPDGKSNKVEYNDDEKAIVSLGTTATLQFLSARHKLDISLIGMKRKAFGKGVSQARAIVLSAAISKGSKDTEEPKVEDEDAQNEFAMALEYQEYVTEMELTEIEEENQ